MVRPRAWSTDDDETLRRLHSAGTRDREIALTIGRSFEAVRHRINVLGLTKTAQRPHDIAKASAAFALGGRVSPRSK